MNEPNDDGGWLVHRGRCAGVWCFLRGHHGIAASQASGAQAEEAPSDHHPHFLISLLLLTHNHLLRASFIHSSFFLLYYHTTTISYKTRTCALIARIPPHKSLRNTTSNKWTTKQERTKIYSTYSCISYCCQKKSISVSQDC